MSASYTDALLAYVMGTVEAKRTMEKEATEIERTHDSLLEEHLEKEREWPEELEASGALLEQREKEQDLDCPLAMVVEQQPKPSTPSPIGRKPSEVESPPQTVARVEQSVYLGLGTGHAISIRGAHESGNLLDGRQGTGGTYACVSA